jgi:hypothetical protein
MIYAVIVHHMDTIMIPLGVISSGGRSQRRLPIQLRCSLKCKMELGQTSLNLNSSG